MKFQSWNFKKSHRLEKSTLFLFAFFKRLTQRGPKQENVTQAQLLTRDSDMLPKKWNGWELTKHTSMQSDRRSPCLPLALARLLLGSNAIQVPGLPRFQGGHFVGLWEPRSPGHVYIATPRVMDPSRLLTKDYLTSIYVPNDLRDIFSEVFSLQQITGFQDKKNTLQWNLFFPISSALYLSSLTAFSRIMHW